MATSIKKQYTYSPSQEQIENRRILTSVLTDFATLRTSIEAITAKLDIDTGVNSTTYNQNNPVAYDLTA